MGLLMRIIILMAVQFIGEFAFASLPFYKNISRSDVLTSIVKVKSSYLNHCVKIDSKCNEYVAKNGNGILFKFEGQQTHYFLLTVSHLSQGSDLTIQSLDLSQSYKIKKYILANGQSTSLRIFDNVNDIEFIEIEDPHLSSYFTLSRTPTGHKILSHLCMPKIEKSSPDDSSNDVSSDALMSAGDSISNSFIYLYPKLVNLDIKNKISEKTRDFDLFYHKLEGLQQVDPLNVLEEKVEFTFGLNEFLLPFLVRNGQSGLPLFTDLSGFDNYLCVAGLVKGFHRTFQKSFVVSLERTHFFEELIKQVDKLESNSLNSNLDFQHSLNQVSWSLADHETFRVYKLSGTENVFSEVTSWYTPTGGETADGGESTLPQKQIGNSVYFEPGLSYKKDIIVGVELNTSDEKKTSLSASTSQQRTFFANLKSIQFINNFPKNKIHWITKAVLGSFSNLSKMISKRLYNGKVLADELNEFKQANWELFKYQFWHKYSEKLSTFSADANEDANSAIHSKELQGWADNFRYLLVDDDTNIFTKQSLQNFNIPKTSLQMPSDCRVQVLDKTIKLTILSEIMANGLTNDQKINFQSQINPLGKKYVTITLDSNLRPINWVFDGEKTAIQIQKPDFSEYGVDLRPKIFYRSFDHDDLKNTFIVDIRGLLFLDLNFARTRTDMAPEYIEFMKEKYPDIVEGPFYKIIDPAKNLTMYSPEANLLSKVSHVMIKPFGTSRDYILPCSL